MKPPLLKRPRPKQTHRGPHFPQVLTAD
uniref:Uncharacterized protein n=1 Tax=Anguilla anguilla TaxID=7936 RepID=A0A0E9Q239_ANGAN